MQQRKKPWWMFGAEWEMLNNGNWELVHDGQKNPLQFEFPPEDVKCFTRKYRYIKPSGWHGVIRSITWQYDLREGWRDIAKIELVFEDSRHRKSKEVLDLSEHRGRV